MTLSAFAIACGAEPKWVQNVARTLGRPLAYTESEAQRLGLVRLLQAELGATVERADEMAGRALGSPGSALTESGERSVVSVAIDLGRYLSDFSVRLSRSREQYEPRKRGRRAKRGSAVQRARDYGLDVTLLASALAHEPGDRLRRLSSNMAFVKALRGTAQKRGP
jgi:hypothetical protein